MTSVPPTGLSSPGGPPAHGGPALPGRGRWGAAGWRPWTAWVALLAGFAATIVGSIIVGLVAGAAGADLDNTPAGIDIGLTVFQNVALFGAAYLFARGVSRPTADDFGLRPPPSIKRAIGRLLRVWFIFFAFAILWAAIIGVDEESELPERLGVDDSTVNLLAVTFLVTVVAPVGEELFFRGFFFGALRNWRGPWPAAIITGLVFGAIHLGSAPASQLVPLAVLGAGLCMLYHWTGSLYPCIVLHAFNNALAFGVGEGWPAEVVVGAMAGAAIVSIGVAACIRRALGPGARAAPAPAG
ncbi:MAG: lysostaphin resistance A-like protein [Solirubrobacteraceae bacterium]